MEAPRTRAREGADAAIVGAQHRDRLVGRHEDRHAGLALDRLEVLPREDPRHLAFAQKVGAEQLDGARLERGLDAVVERPEERDGRVRVVANEGGRIECFEHIERRERDLEGGDRVLILFFLMQRNCR